MVEKKKLGFASMDPARQREIAAMGGRAVKTRSFSVNRELAQRAGRIGGKNVPSEKRTYSLNKTFASECGRKGGLAVPAAKRTFSLNPELARSAGAIGGTNSRKGS